MFGRSTQGSLIQTTCGWPGLLLRLLTCTAFFWVFLWAFAWSTGQHKRVAVKGNITSYVHKPASGGGMGSGSPVKAVCGVRPRIGDREPDLIVWIKIGNLDAARRPELPQLVGREIDAQIGLGGEIYGLCVGRDPPDIWFTAEETIAAKWAMFVHTLKVTAGIALFFALISSLDVFRRKPD